MKIHIATSRDTGRKCKKIADEMGYKLVDMESCDVFISVLSEKIIPQEYLDSRPCFNFHPGILPWYRGVGIQSWVLINGESEAGATLHKMSKEVDKGEIIAIRRFPVKENDTAEDLFYKVGLTIEIMFGEWLPKLCTGQYPTMKQNKGRTYYHRDLEKAKDLTRYIKAFTFKGKEKAYWVDDKGNKNYI